MFVISWKDAFSKAGSILTATAFVAKPIEIQARVCKSTNAPSLIFHGLDWWVNSLKSFVQPLLQSCLYLLSRCLILRPCSLFAQFAIVLVFFPQHNVVSLWTKLRAFPRVPNSVSPTNQLNCSPVGAPINEMLWELVIFWVKILSKLRLGEAAIYLVN